MSNIVRRDPFAIEDMLDDLFKGYLVRPLRQGGEMPELRMIKMDVKEGDKVLRSERYYGRVSRSLTLEQPVDESKATAKFDNGVLQLVLPKMTVTPSRRLAIE